MKSRDCKMKYFSGFSFFNESEIFNSFLPQNDFCVAGFSYGAIKALRYTLQSPHRIDKLILLSPAFFNDKNAKFKKIQILFFAKEPQKYIDNFIQNVTYPASLDLSSYIKIGSKEELKDLLEYDWSDLDKLDANIKLEIHLGAKDKIINPKKAHEFFKNYGESYLYKNYGHLLN